MKNGTCLLLHVYVTVVLGTGHNSEFTANRFRELILFFVQEKYKKNYNFGT